MNGLETVSVGCPACGESIELVIDCSQRVQRYIEDCEVCCRPLHVRVSIDDAGTPIVQVFRENDE